KRRSRQKPAIADWHLWSEVTRSVSPLPGKPVRVIPPPNEAKGHQDPARTGRSPKKPNKDGGALFRNIEGSGPAAWSPGTQPVHKQKIFGPEPTGIEPRMHRR